MNNKNRADDYFLNIQQMVWVILSCLAVYILLYTWTICENPAETLGNSVLIPEMIENLLAGCVVIVAAGALFEFLSAE